MWERKLLLLDIVRDMEYNWIELSDGVALSKMMMRNVYRLMLSKARLMEV